MPDTLLVVLKLRAQGVDSARAALMAAIQDERAAADKVAAVESRIDAERIRASDLDGGDDLVEAYAAWLPSARADLATAHDAQERALADLACRRAELTAAQTGLETIKTLLARREDEAAAAERRREQEAMDEVAARLRLRVGPHG